MWLARATPCNKAKAQAFAVNDVNDRTNQPHAEPCRTRVSIKSSNRRRFPIPISIKSCSPMAPSATPAATPSATLPAVSTAASASRAAQEGALKVPSAAAMAAATAAAAAAAANNISMTPLSSAQSSSSSTSTSTTPTIPLANDVCRTSASLQHMQQMSSEKDSKSQQTQRKMSNDGSSTPSNVDAYTTQPRRAGSLDAATKNTATLHKTRGPTPIINLIALRKADQNADLYAKLSLDGSSDMSMKTIISKLSKWMTPPMYKASASSCTNCRRFGVVCSLVSSEQSDDSKMSMLALQDQSQKQSGKNNNPCEACFFFKTECTNFNPRKRKAEASGISVSHQHGGQSIPTTKSMDSTSTDIVQLPTSIYGDSSNSPSKINSTSEIYTNPLRMNTSNNFQSPSTTGKLDIAAALSRHGGSDSIPKELADQIGFQLKELSETVGANSNLVHAVEEVGTFSGEKDLSRKESQTVVATALAAALSIILNECS